MDNFVETAPTIAPITETTGRNFAAGVLRINLVGPIGDDKAFSLQGVRRQLAGRNFDHLHLDIGSPGGTSAEAFAIYDMLRALPVPISARATGQCLSAALVVLMSADLRSASPSTTFLLHPSSCERDILPERLTNRLLREHADRLAAIDDHVANLFANRTGWRAEWFATEMETEDSLAVGHAIECGLVHEVDGLTQPVDPCWPEFTKQIAPDRRYYPQRYFTRGYFAACRTASSLYARESV